MAGALGAFAALRGLWRSPFPLPTSLTTKRTAGGIGTRGTGEAGVRERSLRRSSSPRPPRWNWRFARLFDLPRVNGCSVRTYALGTQGGAIGRTELG